MIACPTCGWLHFGEHDCPFEVKRPVLDEPKAPAVTWGGNRERPPRLPLDSPDWMPRMGRPDATG